MSLSVKVDTSAPSAAGSPDGTVANPLIISAPAQPLPPGATQLQNGSGSVSASSAVATLTSAAGRTAYLTGFAVTGLGATAATMAQVSITGLLGGTLNYFYPVPAGVGVAGPPMVVNFQTPLVASAVNTNIVVTVSTFGSGNVGASVVATGYMI